MHKKDVLAVGLGLLNSMVEQRYTNRDFIAWSVSGHLSGKPAITAAHAVSIGSDFGLSKVTLSDGCANYLATVPLLLKVLRITGLSKYHQSRLVIRRFNIWSTMPHISTRTAA